MADDDRDADVITLPMINLLGPDDGSADDAEPTVDELPDAVPPPDFSLPFNLPQDEEDSADHDSDNAAGEMVANAVSGTGTPNRATASMAMVTMAAIAVAAVRGTWSIASYLKARREHHDAVADKARETADSKKVANAKNRVPSGSEWGRGAKGAGGRGGSTGSSSGRGAFGQKSANGVRQATGNGSTGTGGRGAGAKAAKGAGSDKGSGGKGARGTGGSSGASGSPGKGGGSGAGSGGSAKKPGTLGQMALARQKRKNDDRAAERKAAADERKADLADRAAARKEAAAEAAERRKRKAERRKRKHEREKAGTGDTPKEPKEPKDTGGPAGPKGDKEKKDDGAAKVDLKKKPKVDESSKADKGDGGDDTTKTPPKSTTSTKPRKPRRKNPPWSRRSRRRKPSNNGTGPKSRSRHRKTPTGGHGGPGGMPGGDGEWLRPPPGWDVSYSVTIERTDRPRRPQPRRLAPIGSGHKGLPTGTSGQAVPTRTEPKGPIVMGTAMEVGEAGDTQFVDADLTVYDLIDSDEEMSEQILGGVDHMRLVASKCEGLKAGLENLYAMCLQKKVPGVLVRWCIRLMERAGSVQDKAEALAQSLPRASEAILTARDVAVEADKNRADAVKDAGHVAPAEREYHDRSGV